MMTNAFLIIDGHRVTQRRGERGEHLDCLADVAERGRRADGEPGGEIGVGLALAQVRDSEQGLFPDRQAPPSGPDRGASVAQRVGEGDEGVVGHGEPRGVGRHPKLLVRRIDLGNRPYTRSFTHLGDATPHLPSRPPPGWRRLNDGTSVICRFFMARRSAETKT
jgi:hypothetical protein